MTVPQEKLADLKVLETIKEGVSIYKRPTKVSAISSPAVFGITLNNPHHKRQPHFGGRRVCGDGCFNHGLSVLVHAFNGTVK